MTRASAASPRAREIAAIPESLKARVRIETVSPSVDSGRFPIKRVAGERVEVTADVLVDGHDRLAVHLLHRRRDGSWSRVGMEARHNDRFVASFEVRELGVYEYGIEAWVDRFASWTDELRKKHAAGQDVTSELLEGAALVEAAARRATGPDREWLNDRARELGAEAEPEPDTDTNRQLRVERALAPDLSKAMTKYGERGDVIRSATLEVQVERVRAREGAWYEMFPRSAGRDPERSATFDEAAERLPAIAAMGFDVLYLPPIHPIGRKHRKGPNNTLRAAPGDPGSPWAIGAEEGGHDAVEPGLGTIDDFDRFVAKARSEGLEIALDLAFQCSPDHPYVREHPEWFRHRPDGTIKYAENPPKKYQDIFPLDFECERWRELWSELRRVVLFWVDHGVRIFRVDNPHTKSFGFWEWLISDVRSRHPDVVFLAEAFTRPKVLRHLAKVGFSQSYTYFTWRNAKDELTRYLTELTQTDVAEYLRPNLFANTPDIFHEYLQFGGRPAFQIRLVLAATLGATYGIYGPPFELCETAAVPGTEEYQNSEKYQIRVWDHDRAGNIVSFIKRVNRIRSQNPVLLRNRNLRFHPVDNDRLLFYSKDGSELDSAILVVVNLDPHHEQSGWIELPLEALGVGPEDVFQVHDLLGDSRFLWRGARNYVRLDPKESPAQIFRLRRKVRTEKDFDYYL